MAVSWNAAAFARLLEDAYLEHVRILLGDTPENAKRVADENRALSDEEWLARREQRRLGNDHIAALEENAARAAVARIGVAWEDARRIGNEYLYGAIGVERDDW